MASRSSHDIAVIDDDELTGLEDTNVREQPSRSKRSRNVSFPEEDREIEGEGATGPAFPQHHGRTTPHVKLRARSTPSINSNDPRIGHFERLEHATSPNVVIPNNHHSHYENDHKLEKAESRRTDGTRMSASEISHRENLAHARAIIGLDPTAPITDEGHDLHEQLTWSSIRIMFREPFAEFFGTFIMILFGNGSVAQVLLSTGQETAPGGSGFGQYQSITWGWGLGVMLGIYVAGDSGAFLNPAITFNFCLFRHLPWRRWPVYFVAQFLGAFCASGVVYANYFNAINALEGSSSLRTVPPVKTASAGIFCTYPQAFMTTVSMFFSEFIASAILMFVIFALKDGSNPGAMGKTGAGALFPLALFFLIFGLGACFGWETGYAINLVRDFPPRLMSYFLGYGHNVWSAGNYYFWIPMVAPFCGTTFGGLLYDLFIYTGPESPVNMPWLGLPYLLKDGYWKQKKEKGEYEV